MEKYYNLKKKIEDLIGEFGYNPNMALTCIDELLKETDKAEREMFAIMRQEVNLPPQGETVKE